MSNKASNIRSREISLNIGLQGLTQLFQIYGRDNGKTILNNLKTKIVYPGLSDEEALKYLSILCGEKEIEISSRNESKDNHSNSYNKTKIRMFSESDLRCLNDDEILIITNNKQPILSKKNIYYKNPIYASNVKGPVKIDKKSNEIIDIYDYIQDLKVDIAISKEQDFDIKSDLFR
jgi:type IV secretion system protein VirD4